ncbi:hypothetical protein PCASD_06770 [Puccinia coronata f. sp. avenae]|uniref:Phosphatidylinositol-specific phospholipase C X domain-containing protein n=1 Tax=Puccinia coronata f. sp. avenae TaxID=200324 RepID=A0A2N5V0H4_9BASI|nr:hypothetical protein PCASD_06770 [Puccinia coronata f. sp. avenae]
MAAVSPPETCSGAAPRPTDPSHHPQSHEKRPGHISCHHRIAISPSSGLPPSHSSAPTSTSPVCHHLMCLFHPQKNWKRFFTSSILAAILLCTLLYEPFGWAKPVRSSELDQVNFELSFKVYNASTQHSEPRQSDETENRILNAAPILGFYEQSNAKLSDWMSNVPDDTPITSMSIPGTHDAATWNYTQATQDSLEAVTGKIPPAIAYQCQDRSLFQMLGDGIRFFDLRVGFLPDHQQLGFFHASALLSTTATLPDVLLGFYKWLDHHPTETILVSIKVDNATFGNPPPRDNPRAKTCS